MMKKRHILHSAMGVLMTPLLGSCAADDVAGGAGREECDIISGQPMTVTSATRATDGSTSSTQFEQDQIVWLWANKADGSEYITAWQLTAQSGGNLTGSSAKYWPSNGSHLNVYALHGNFKDSQIMEGSPSWSNLSLTHTVASDQSSDENKRLSDLLYSHSSTPSSTTPTAFAPNNTVQLAFDHLLAKITVKLDLKNSKGISNTELDNAEVTLTNILTTGIFNSYDVNNIITSGVNANTSGSREDIKAGIITQPSDMNSTAYEVGSAIVPLQNFGATNSNKITIKLRDTRSFSYTPADVTLGKGNEYIYTLKIINGELSVSSIIVNEFTTEETQNKSWDIYVEPSGS